MSNDVANAVASDVAPSSTLTIRLFGPPRICLNEQPIHFESRKAVALLAYLSCQSEPRPRAEIGALLWPESDRKRSLGALRYTLSLLRKQLGEQWFDVDRQSIGLRVLPQLTVDVRQFLCHKWTAPENHDQWQQMAALEDQVALYSEDFLATFGLRDSVQFDEWHYFQAEELRSILAKALRQLVTGYASAKDFPQAIIHAERWVALDSLQEERHQTLIGLYIAAGQRDIALRQYEACCHLLQAEMGLRPSAAMQALLQRIQEDPTATELPATDSPATGELGMNTPAVEPSTPAGNSARSNLRHASSSSSATRQTALHHLPSELTPFIGRQDDLEELCELLFQPDCRLLTIVGPGGMGKTRLVQHVARTLSSLDVTSNGRGQRFSDGIYFVGLAAVDSAPRLLQTLGEALGLAFSGRDDPMEKIAAFLAEKRMLLILDNFEQLMPAAPLLTELLSLVAHVSIMVTSRERLNLYEEWLFDLDGLTVPEDDYVNGLADPQSAIEQLPTYGSVQLFQQRARRLNRRFNLEEEGAAVVRICHLVEGMPLAIELAASWTRSLSCEQIEAEVRRNYDFLTTDTQNVAHRQRSLRATFNYSWDLLTPEQKSSLKFMSVFRGGFTQDASLNVANADPAMVQALQDKSLLLEVGDNRLELHELIRQFTFQKLREELGTLQAVVRNHCDYYAAFLNETASQLHGPAQREVIAEIYADMDNIRAGWQWAVANQHVRALELAAPCLWDFTPIRGSSAETETMFASGATALQQLLESEPDEEPKQAEPHGAIRNVMALLMGGQGYFLALGRSLEEGRSLLEEGLAILQQSKPRDIAKEATLLSRLTIIANDQGNYEDVLKFATGSLALFEELAHERGMATSHLDLGMSYIYRGQLTKAEEHLQNSVNLLTALGEKRIRAISMRGLAQIAVKKGAYQRAHQLLGECLEISREFDDATGMFFAFNELGRLHMAEGMYDQAESMLNKCIVLVEESGNQWYAPYNTIYQGELQRLKQNYAEAEHLLQRCIDAFDHAGNLVGRTRANGVLGQLAADRADFAMAQNHYEDALSFWRANNNAVEIASTLCQLGFLTLHEHPDHSHYRESKAIEQPVIMDNAIAYYAESVQFAQRVELWPVLLESLAGMAKIMLHANERAFAQSAMQIVLVHPAATYQTRQWITSEMGDSELIEAPEAPADLDEQLDRLITQVATYNLA